MKFLIFILISWEHFYLIAKRKPNQSTQIKSNVNLYSESAEDLDQGGGEDHAPILYCDWANTRGNQKIGKI